MKGCLFKHVHAPEAYKARYQFNMSHFITKVDRQALYSFPWGRFA